MEKYNTLAMNGTRTSSPNHSHGIKVMLEPGQVGRIRQIR